MPFGLTYYKGHLVKDLKRSQILYNTILNITKIYYIKDTIKISDYKGHLVGFTSLTTALTFAYVESVSVSSFMTSDSVLFEDFKVII